MNRNLRIKVQDGVASNIINMKLKDLCSKHVFYMRSNKADKVLEYSCEINYPGCQWGYSHNRVQDFELHSSIIHKMEEDNYIHAMRIVACKYDFCDETVYWVDNLHSCIKWIRQCGFNIRLRDTPFYVVEINTSDLNNIIVRSYKDSVRDSNEDIFGAVSCSLKRLKRSNSAKLISVHYTIEDFLIDNFEFLLE